MIFRRLRDLREDRDWKQTDLAARLGIRQTTYSKYELGKVTVPVDMLMRLADLYDTSVDYLLERTDARAPYPKGKHS